MGIWRERWENGPDSQGAYLSDLDRDVRLADGGLQRDAAPETNDSNPMSFSMGCHGSIHAHVYSVTFYSFTFWFAHSFIHQTTESLAC